MISGDESTMLAVNAGRRRLLFGRSTGHEPAGPPQGRIPEREARRYSYEPLPPPRILVAAIGDPCLARRNVVCRSCGDECEAAAIRFRPVIGGVPAPALDLARCTGCGECVRVCPTAAIAMVSGAGSQSPDGAGAI